MEKMSEVIKEFAAPWLQQAPDERSARTILTAAALAWDMSLYPRPEREQVFAQILDGKLSDEQETVVQEMIARKENLFAGNQRWIVDCQMRTNGNGSYSLTVLSTLERPVR